MNFKNLIVILVLVGFGMSRAVAKCSVERYPIEKQVFQVFKNGKRISSPDLACLGTPVVSPSGHYIAFTDCERDYNRLGDNSRLYQLVIFNCETGRDAGFLPTSTNNASGTRVHAWSNDEQAVQVIRRTEPVGAETFAFRFTGAESLP